MGIQTFDGNLSGRLFLPSLQTDRPYSAFCISTNISLLCSSNHFLLRFLLLSFFSLFFFFSFAFFFFFLVNLRHLSGLLAWSGIKRSTKHDQRHAHSQRINTKRTAGKKKERNEQTDFRGVYCFKLINFFAPRGKEVLFFIFNAVAQSGPGIQK